MTKRLLTFAAKAVWLLFHFISQTIASQASDARSDGIALVEFAKAIPGLQNMAGASRSAAATTSRTSLIVIEQLIIITVYGGGTSWTVAIPDNYTDVSTPPSWCSFYGVKCGTISTGVDYRRVTDISIDNLLLTGTLPVFSHLGEMTKLQIKCYTSGAIPPSISILSKLKILNFAYSRLAGTIPSFLGSLIQLRELDLYYNQLTGTIPSSLSSLSTLSVLRIIANQLRGTIPSFLGSLIQLRELNFYNNQLTGTIPSTLCSLSKVDYLSFAANKLTGTIPSILGSLSKLYFLNFSNNQLRGAIPSTLGGLAHLVSLFLSSNQLTGTIPSILGSLAHLNGLTLSRNQLSGTIPSTLGSLSKLSGLFLHSNQLSGTIPLLNQPSLRNIYLNTNYLTMGSLAEVPLSTFSATSLSSSGVIVLRNNCLKFRHPNDINLNVDPTRCTGEQATNIIINHTNHVLH